MLPHVLQVPAVPALKRPRSERECGFFEFGGAPGSRIDLHAAGARLDCWNRGNYTSTRSASARSILAELKPQVLAAAQAAPDAGEIIDGFDRLVRQLSVGTHLFSTLAADSSALQTLLQLVSRAPRLASKIADRPDFFDALISHQNSADVMSSASLSGVLAHLKQSCATDDEFLQGIKTFTRKHQFLLGARTVLGWSPFGKAAEGYSKLANAVVQTLARFAERNLKMRDGRPSGNGWALVALGKFGGFELSATSDLDLLFVYECSDDDQYIDGARSRPAVQYFGMLAQKVIEVLGMSDTDGPLYETDFRLRPWGNKGQIATRLSTLRDYLVHDAWTYERMAMTRARAITGTPRFSRLVESAIREALHQPGASSTVRADVVTVRRLVHSVKETENPWDIKNVPGGLVDIEFLAQYLMLRHAHAQPGLIHPATAEALRRLYSAGFLSQHDFGLLSEALSFFRDLMQVTRGACTSGPLPESISMAFAAHLPAMLGEGNLGAVEVKLCQFQASVQNVFERLTNA